MWRRVLEVAGLYLGPGSLLSTVIICGNETGKRGKLRKGTTSECITLMGKWGSILDRGGSWGVYLQTFVSYCLRVVPQHVWPPPCSERSWSPAREHVQAEGEPGSQQPARECTSDLCAGDAQREGQGTQTGQTLPATSATWISVRSLLGREDSRTGSLTSSKKVLVCSTISLK